MIPKIKNYKEILKDNTIKKIINPKYSIIKLSYKDPLQKFSISVPYEETFYDEPISINIDDYCIERYRKCYDFYVYYFPLNFENYCYYMVDNNKIPIGYMIAKNIKNISSMYIYPKFQRQGYMGLLIYDITKTRNLYFDMNHLDSKNTINLLKKSFSRTFENNDNICCISATKENILMENSWYSRSFIQNGYVLYGPRIYNEGYEYWTP